jgi:ATP-binding cassette, subfamily F, member 3
MLERLTAIEPARAKREWRFEFLEPVKLPERLLDADRPRARLRRASRPERHPLRRALGRSHRHPRGQRRGQVDPGQGDLRRPRPAAGELLRGQGLAIGYFAQHQLDQLRADETPLAHLRRLAPEAREQELRDFLGTYRFSGEMATSLIGPMSGGEKARCALALIAWKRPNVLVLDEPTNHLDMETREALTVALSSYEGALILVSHDRHLLRATVNQLWLVHDGRVGPFDGDLDDYTALVLASRRSAPTPTSAPGTARDASSGSRRPPNGSGSRRPASPCRTSSRRPRQNWRRSATSCANSMRGSPTRPSITPGARTKWRRILKRRGELAPQVETLEARWLKLQEELEALA